MTLAQLRKRALAKYGLSRFGDEDPLFHQVLLNDLVNEAHRWLAEEARLYRETITTDLPIASGGVSTVTLDADAWEVDFEAVRVRSSSSGDWQQVNIGDENMNRRLHGPPENTSSDTLPDFFWFRTTNTADAHRQMILWPGATAAVTDGLKYDAWVYPATLSADTDTPVFGPAVLHDHLIPAVCWKMAEVEASRGRQDAPVAYWKREAETACAALQTNLSRFRTPGPRSARLRAIDFM